MLPKKNKEIKNKTIAGLLKEAGFLLRSRGVELPEMEAELLLAYVLGKDRVFVIAHPEYPVNSVKTFKFLSTIKKRLSGYSSAVLIGHKEFYGLDFVINKDVLVPRPETELLVDTIIQRAKKTDNNLIIDIGTGSGAIIVSLFKNLNTAFNYYASDKSLKALEVARNNARRLKANINFIHGDLLSPYINIINNIKPSNIIIAANLPYLKPEEMNELSIKREPKSALLSGADGLWHYRRLFVQLKKAELKNVFLACEINPEQASDIKKQALTCFPSAKISWQNDYTSRVRFFILEI